MVMLMAVLTLTGCGGQSGGGSGGSEPASADSLKTIGDVIDIDSEDIQSAVYEDKVVYAFKLGDSYYRAIAKISPEDAQAYFDIDYSDDDFEEQQKAIVAPLKIDTLENLDGQILSEEERSALVGKTGQELQNAGWTYNGHDLESMEFWMYYGPFLYTVAFDGEVAEADYDDFDDEAGTRDLTVKSVELMMLGNATDIEE